MYFLFIWYDMFHFNKHFNRIIVITGACLIISAAPIFANAQPVVDSPANIKLQNIYDRLGSMYQNCMVPQYNILSTYCNYKLSDINASILAVGGQTADVSSKLLTTNNYLSSIDSKTIDRNYTQYIDGIESELNNINWKQSTINNLMFQDLSGTPITASRGINDCYVIINYNDFYKASDIQKLKLAIMPNNPSSELYIDRIGIYNSSNIYSFYDVDIPLQYDGYGGIESSYITFDYGYSAHVAITNSSINIIKYEIKSRDGLNFYLSNINYAESFYLDNESEDYLKVYNFLNLKKLDNTNSNLQKLVDVYASDDVIAAKEAQQAYENQAITDFTGSGSAAASGSDTTNMKNVSRAIKSGLDSGGSVNGALGVFNTSGGLWDWFSQSNYDEINGTQTRSRGSDEYIDFYNINREELERLLQEER